MLWGIYYIKAGRRVWASTRYISEAEAYQAARDRGYYDGMLWKARKVS